jgi:alpha-amylase
LADIIFGIHCHQPVGNFEDVIVKAFNKAYKPFIKAISKSSLFKLSVHFSGVLLEWIKEREQELFETIGRLIDSGRCEPVIGGFYEPILAVIPRDDRIEQVMLSKEWVKREWGFEPKGLWLTERVWDSSIVEDLVDCGIEFVIVDDYHLVASGIPESKIEGYFLTEKNGFRLKVFPISEKLRYLIPFKPIRETIEFLSKRRGTLLIFDDGEKFGIWPSTYKWVYEDGWLESFVSAVEEGKINMKLFSEVIENENASGLCYMPIISYFEMGEWSLLPKEGYKFNRFIKELKEQGLFEEYRPFLKGGIWHNFFVKYEETNRMHKKMLMISKELRLHRVEEDVKNYLFKAQCNDAYWHGIFGGLYLPHLRRAVYENLLKAERYLPDKVVFDDSDFDGKKEIYLRKDGFVLWIYPHKGGMAKELSLRGCSLNIADTLRRIREAYHMLTGIGGSEKDEGISSIHEIERALEFEPEYDSYDRGVFLDRYFLKNSQFSLADSCYNVERILEDTVELSYSDSNLELRKTYSVKGNSLTVSYVYNSSIAIRPEVELNLNLGTNQATFIVDGIPFSMSKSTHLSGVKELKFVTPFIPGYLLVRISSEVELFVVPIFTVSQSEAGFEKVYQNSAVIFKYPEEVNSREFYITLEVRYA